MTTNNQANNPTQTEQNLFFKADADQATEKPGFGAPKAITAFSLLFQAAVKNLSQDELEYLAGLACHAQVEADNLSESLMMMGDLISNVEKFHQPSCESIGQMVWSLSNQLDHIAGLIGVSSEAIFQLEERRKQNQRA